MKEIRELIKKAQVEFKQKLLSLDSQGGLTQERYARFLTMQYHLTKGVQRHFMAIAANSITANRRNLRKFLINFAQEEEFHYEIAKADLKALGREVEEIPLDTKIWWLFFDSIIEDRPFIRLGATCILENISSEASDILDALIKNSNYLNPKNLRFLTIHRHGPNLAHGDQILEAIQSSDLSNAELDDLAYGAHIATIFYMRSIHWIVTGEPLK